jgi:prephenate dehydrogenase
VTAAEQERTLAILGLGLMGASLAMAARRGGGFGRIVGYARRQEACNDAMRRRVVDAAYPDAAMAARDADVVVVCVPVLTVPKVIAACAGSWRPGCVVTDVGSTKQALVRDVEALLDDQPVTFVGGHPIAGSDRTGMKAARADLYAGAVVVLTPARDAPADACATLRRLWESVGARVVTMSAARHDDIVARTSHLPHLAAVALVRSVLDEAPEEERLLCGTGFRDATRIAAGSDELWHDIVRSNRDAVMRELDDYAGRIAELRDLVASEDYDALRAYLLRAAKQRRELNDVRKEAGP